MVEPEPTIHRVATVERQIGSSVLLVVPRTREIRLLGPTASIVWHGLRGTGDRDRLDGMLGEIYPDVPDEERVRAVHVILETLESDGLVAID